MVAMNLGAPELLILLVMVAVPVGLVVLLVKGLGGRNGE
jgi:hypothetical protein